jgi:hypothetical protein
MFFKIPCSFPIDRSIGDRVKLPELRQMVKEDPTMQDLSKEDEEELRGEVIAAREQKRLGARPTNQAASQDYRRQLETLNEQVRFFLPALLMTNNIILTHRSPRSLRGQVLRPYASSVVDTFRTLLNPTGFARRMHQGSRVMC